LLIVKSILIFLLIVSIPNKNSIIAQSTVKIAGTVRDAYTGAPITGVHVLVVGTAVGAVTDSKGQYRIEYLPLGTYTIRASHINYTTSEKYNVIVREDYTARCDFILTQKAFTAEEILVSAEPYRLRSVPVTQGKTTITRRELELQNSRNAAEVLESIPGLQILDSGGASGGKRVSLRGGAANQVLVLLDGRRINSGQDDTVDLSNLPVSIIENIEVVKGNLSALYGPNAVNGVINITTRSPEKSFPVAARYSTGSFGERIYGTELSGKISSYELLASAEHGDYTGDYKYTDPHDVEQVRSNAHKYYNSLFGKIRKLSRWYDFSLQSFLYRADQGIPGIIFQETPEAESDYKKDMLSFGGYFKTLDNMTTEINLSYNKSRTRNANPIGITFDTFSRNTTRQVELVNHFTFRKFHSFDAGAAYKKDILRHIDYLHKGIQTPYSNFEGEKWQEVQSAFISANFSFDIPYVFDLLHTNAALRYDRHSRISSQTSPKIGASLSRKGKIELVIRANYGRSYRPPNFDDLFYEGYRVQGNPDLRPERSKGGDAGIELKFSLYGSIRAEHTYYHSVVKDIILWRQRFDGVFSPYNISRSKMFGSESSFEWKSPRDIVSFSAGHTYSRALNQSGERNTDNKQLPHRPVHMTFIKLSCSHSGFTAGFRKRFVSRRFIREANTKPMPGYDVTDLFSSYKFSARSFEITSGISIDNITNEEYMILERAPLPGRAVRFSISVQFKTAEEKQ